MCIFSVDVLKIRENYVIIWNLQFFPYMGGGGGRLLNFQNLCYPKKTFLNNILK